MMHTTKSKTAIFLLTFCVSLGVAVSVIAAEKPTVYFPGASDATKNSILLTGKYAPADEDFLGYFEYKLPTDSAYLSTPERPITGGSFGVVVTGLKQSVAGTKYLFRSVVIAGDGSKVRSTPDNDFTTAPDTTATPDETNQNQNTQQNQQSTTTPADSASLVNPLRGINTIPDFIAKILDIMLRIAVPVLVCFFIYTGFLFIKARGNEKELEHAKENLKYALIGAALILGAWTLANALSGTINQLR